MAAFKPFAAHRFSGRDLTGFLCPPYDVIGDAQARRLRRRRTNAIRLELPGADYAAAAQVWREWVDGGVLERDPRPAFYVCEQTYRWGARSLKRLGVFGALSVEGRGVVAHERTFPKPRQDRMRLLKALRANTSPVFGTYRDPRRTLASLAAGRPDAVGRDEGGVRYRLWRVDGAREVAALAAAVARSKVLIADGHHRFRVAADYRRESGRPGSEAALVYLVPESDPGLIVLPTHRLLPRRDFPFERLARTCRTDERPSLAALERSLKGVSFGLVVRAGGRAAYRLCRPRAEFGAAEGAKPALDVEWVQRRLLKDVPPAAFSYLHDAADADRRVRSSSSPELVAVLLGPLTVPRIRRAVEKNGLLPQKSTYFFPKVATGLLFRSLDGRSS